MSKINVDSRLYCPKCYGQVEKILQEKKSYPGSVPIKVVDKGHCDSCEVTWELKDLISQETKDKIVEEFPQYNNG